MDLDSTSTGDLLVTMKGKTVQGKLVHFKTLFSLKLPIYVTVSSLTLCFLDPCNHDSVTEHTECLIVPSFVVVNLVL